MAGIRLLETLVLNGPNYWSYRPCVWMRIDLGEFREKPSNQLDGFPRQLAEMLPGLREHHCSEGAPGGFLKRLGDESATKKNQLYFLRGSTTVKVVSRSLDRTSAVPPWPLAISRTMYKPRPRPE